MIQLNRAQEDSAERGKRVENRLLDHYRKENGVYYIDVAVESFDELFSKHDPAPMHQRDLSNAIAKHLKDQIIFFPKRETVYVMFHLPKKYSKHEVDIKNAFRHHFEFEYLDSDLHMMRRVFKGRKILGVAFLIFMTLITLSYLIEHYFTQNALWVIISESLFVGSWVSMWYPVEILLYEWIPLMEDKKVYQRLKQIPIKFNYK